MYRYGTYQPVRPILVRYWSPCSHFYKLIILAPIFAHPKWARFGIKLACHNKKTCWLILWIKSEVLMCIQTLYFDIMPNYIYFHLYAKRLVKIQIRVYCIYLKIQYPTSKHLLWDSTHVHATSGGATWWPRPPQIFCKK